MKRIKNRILVFYTQILSSILVMLGFASCSDNPFLNPKDEYGTPSAKYRIKGTVKSGETQIKGIKVVAVRTINGQIDEYEQPVSSQSDGKFTLELRSFPDKNADFEIKFEDVDGEANGGLFETKIETVNFKDAKFTGGSGWYEGETEKDIKTVELTLAKKN